MTPCPSGYECYYHQTIPGPPADWTFLLQVIFAIVVVVCITIILGMAIFAWADTHQKKS